MNSFKIMVPQHKHLKYLYTKSSYSDPEFGTYHQWMRHIRTKTTICYKCYQFGACGAKTLACIPQASWLGAAQDTHTSLIVCQA